MKNLIILSLLILPSLGGAKVSTRSGNHCTDQAVDHLRSLFGESMKIERVDVESQIGDSVSIWIRTNLCRGSFVAVAHKNSTCVGAHYGRVPRYIRRMWASGDCHQLLPQDAHP